MSNFSELTRKRFSARDYLDKPVEKEKIELCLEAARLAPSACNSQPWKFIVVDDENLKNRLCDGMFSGFFSSNMFAKKAPVIVVVISEKASITSRVGSAVQDTKFYLLDIGIAVEHFALQASELGLGTCWLGWFNEKEVKKVLGLPSNKKVDIVLSLGYPAKDPPEKRRKPLSEISSFNKY